MYVCICMYVCVYVRVYACTKDCPTATKAVGKKALKLRSPILMLASGEKYTSLWGKVNSGVVSNRQHSLFWLVSTQVY